MSVLVVCAGAQRGPGRDGPQGGRGQMADLPPLLARAMREQQRLRFTGTRRVLVRIGPETSSSTERVWKDSDQMRIEFGSTGPQRGQVVLFRDGKRFHYFPDTNEIQVRPARLEDPMMRLADLVRNRRGEKGPAVREADGGEIARIPTRLLIFSDPRGNVVGRLWVAPQNAMVLKRELLDPAGRVIGSMEYTEVNLNPTFRPGDFEINRKGAKIVTMDDVLENLSVKNGLRAVRLRAGDYTLENVRMIDLNGDGKALAQSYVSQNGSRLTLFVMREKVNAQRLEQLSSREINTAVRVSGGLRYILVGPLQQNQLTELLNRVS